RWRPQPHPVRLAAHRRGLRCPHLPVHRGEATRRPSGARGVDLQGRRGPALLLPPAWAQRGGGDDHDRERVLPGGVPGAPHGVRRGGPTPPEREPGRERRLMLSITDLRASAGDREILHGVDLEVAPGEVHAIMGPNGSGKSTLAHVLAGRDGYQVAGTVTFCGQDLLGLAPEERAALGVFLAFQYPTEIPGVGNLYFLRAAYNALRRQGGQDELGAADFMALAQEKRTRVGMDRSFMSRSVNEGFSGGEKKRNEVLQMAILEP